MRARTCARARLDVVGVGSRRGPRSITAWSITDHGVVLPFSPKEETLKGGISSFIFPQITHKCTSLSTQALFLLAFSVGFEILMHVCPDFSEG